VLRTTVILGSEEHGRTRTAGSSAHEGVRYRHPIIIRFWSNRVGVLGLIIVIAAVTIAILAPLISPYDPLEQDLSHRFAGVGTADHLLGADVFGRDMLSRLIWGGRISLFIGFAAGALAISIGAPIGMLSGYRGGRFDSIVMRLVDVVLAFPYLLFAIVIVGALGPGLRNTIIAISVTNIPFSIRVMRGIVLSVKHELFVEAARSVGASDTRILRTAIFPAILPFVIVSFTVSTGWLILAGASLSFLGLGAQPPNPEWGAMLAESRQYLPMAPHTVLLPGFALMIVAVGLNLAGDAFRDALDITMNE
jgi:peptide/nickel transport system permease protein